MDTKVYVFLPLPQRQGLAIYIYVNEEIVPAYMKKFKRAEIRNRIEYHSNGAEDFWSFIIKNRQHNWNTVYIDKTK